MSTKVTITTDSAVRVISQKIIDEGRELVPNGTDDIAAGESRDFIIDAGQSIRVVEQAAEAAEVTA